jgi:hypothetical protein
MAKESAVIVDLGAYQQRRHAGTKAAQPLPQSQTLLLWCPMPVWMMVPFWQVI